MRDELERERRNVGSCVYIVSLTQSRDLAEW
jgi:hypothetical protein